MTNKTTLKRLKLDPYFNKTIDTNLNVWSHDQNSYEIKFEFYDHQCDKPIDLTGADMRILLDHADGKPKIYPLEIESKVLGLAKFIMPEQIRGCEGKFTAHIYADYPNKTHDFGSFTFYTKLSRLDGDLGGCMDEIYVSEFEKALEDIKAFKVGIDKNINDMQEHFDENYEEVKTNMDEIKQLINDNDVAKAVDFDPIKKEVENSRESSLYGNKYPSLKDRLDSFDQSLNTKYYYIKNDKDFDATGEQDMSQLVQNYLNKGYNLIFPKNSKIKFNKHIIVRGSSIIDFNYATIECEHHGVIIQSKEYPVVKNATIKGVKSNSGSVGVYADWEDWGTRGTLENIMVKNFDIGIRTVRGFHFKLDSVDISDCNVGWSLDWLPYNRLVTNLIINDGVHITECKVGVYTIGVHNTTFNNLTIEHSDFGFVQNQNCKEITFNNGWFESNKVNYTFGSVDLKTGNVTELDEFYVKAPFEIDNLPTFNNVRYMPNVPSEPNNLISEKYSFLSHYIKHTKNDELEMLFKQGIGYRNINNDYIRKVYSNDGTVSNTEVRTPYDVKKITTLSNEKNSSACIATDIDKNHIKSGDVVLLQAKVKSNVTTDIMMTVVDFSGNLIGSKHRNFRVKKGAWRNVFTIAKLDEFSNGASFRLYPNKNNVAVEGLEFSVYDMQVVNLTHSFPDMPIPNDMSSVLVAPKFPYVDYLNHGKTELGQISSRYYADNKPTDPYFGRIIYNMNTHKSEVWNGEKWVEL